MRSALAATPPVSTFIEQVYAQQVVGVSAYTFLDDMLYLELGGYRPLSTNTQLVLGVDTPGQSPISGIAPYWRGPVLPPLCDHSRGSCHLVRPPQRVPRSLCRPGPPSL